MDQGLRKSPHYRPCACGCGQQTRGRHVREHRPHRSYGVMDGNRIHRLRAEKALGKPLPNGAVVDHADGSLSDDAPLVICQSQGYHKLLHARRRVRAAGGNPDADKICSRCRRLKPKAAFHRNRSKGDGFHDWCCECDGTRDRNAGWKERQRRRRGTR